MPAEAPTDPGPVREWCAKLRKRCAQVAEAQAKKRAEQWHARLLAD